MRKYSAGPACCIHIIFLGLKHAHSGRGSFVRVMFRPRQPCYNQLYRIVQPFLARNFRYLSTGEHFCFPHKSSQKLTGEVAASSGSLPPALLERARSQYEEHVQCSKQLAAQFDTTIAKRLGELSAAAKAFEAWERASSVRRQDFWQMQFQQLTFIIVTFRASTITWRSLNGFRATGYRK